MRDRSDFPRDVTTDVSKDVATSLIADALTVGADVVVAPSPPAASQTAAPAPAAPSSLRALLALPPPPVAPALSIEALNAVAADVADLKVLEADPRAARLQVQLLHNRGIAGASALRTWLGHDAPGGWMALARDLAAFPDLDRAVERIISALRQGEPVVVFGDYDADGMTSCALLTEGLRIAADALGPGADVSARIEPYLPTREDDGRGLNLAAIEALGAQGVALILTTDCGTANVAEVARARALGIDVIVTDHHPPHGERAGAFALVNPSCATQPGSSADLAGVGVAFRVVEALLMRLGLPDAARARALAPLLDLVAIGTIGDVVPLTEQSWMLARAGLRRLREAPRPGVRALLAIAGVEVATLSERDISFAIAPRLNAASRLGSPRVALDLLLCADGDEAKRLARQLDDLNITRRAHVEAMLAEARLQLAGQGAAHGVVVVVGEDWPTGMLGLVASRLAEEYGVPAFALGRKGDDYRGSGRAPEGHDLGTLLEAQAGWFSHYGGHRLAAGFTLPAERLDDLRAYLGAAMIAHRQRATAPAARGEHAVGAREVDCLLPLARATLSNADAVAALAPYGARFPEPRFLCSGVRLLRCWRSGADGQTLRIAVEHNRTEHVLYWPRQGALCDELRSLLPTPPVFDVVYSVSSFRARTSGRQELSLRLLSLHDLAEDGTAATR